MTLGELHVPETDYVVVGVRVGMLVVLSDVLELLVADRTVEWTEGAADFGLEGSTAGDGVLQCLLYYQQC